MKISKWVLRNMTREVLAKEGRCTNKEIIEKLERKLGRPLTPGEKSQVTRYLKSHYNIVQEQRSSKNKPYPLTITVYL